MVDIIVDLILICGTSKSNLLVRYSIDINTIYIDIFSFFSVTILICDGALSVEFLTV